MSKLFKFHFIGYVKSGYKWFYCNSITSHYNFYIFRVRFINLFGRCIVITSMIVNGHPENLGCMSNENAWIKFNEVNNRLKIFPAFDIMIIKPMEEE